DGNDIIDGGHGEDVLRGGAGDDLIISRADGREGAVAYDPNRDEGDPYNELTGGKLYPDQPVPGDDLLHGGDGADIFYFQTLINAKERFIREHTRSDGTINWGRIAGENDNIHDHWLDVLGNDTILDFSRDEGDRIVIEGHTTQIASITYGDINNDGVMDHSIITLYSDQGRNGGAHNDDLLGTITVYGDLVKESDIEHSAAPTYGIVATSDDLDEALEPLEDAVNVRNAGRGNDLGSPDDFAADNGDRPVFAAGGSQTFDADERSALVFDHDRDLALEDGTIALNFVVDVLDGHQAIVSKDASGYGMGGHLTVYVEPDGTLVVRLQSTTESHYWTVEQGIEPGKEYDLAISFGDAGFEAYLNGERVAYDTDVTVNLAGNREALIIGGSGMNNTAGEADNIHSHFNGIIEDVRVFNSQLTATEVFGSGARFDHQTLAGTIQSFDVVETASGALRFTNSAGTTTVNDPVSFVNFSNFSARTDDFQFGTAGADSLNGGDGSDALYAQAGNDTLRGRGNDDALFGGAGDDRFYGGDGRDLILGEGGNDTLHGDNGHDTLIAGSGDDELKGGQGADRFYGGLGDDTIYGHSWGDSGMSRNDRAYFDGNFEDYTFDTRTYYNSTRGEDVTVLIVTDAASGGLDGFYEGEDRLIDIDLLVFADQTVAADTLF
ncbi:LamG-like jellyroll fold domain-containing protein, partial [Pseudaestuariivita atlantica]